MIDVVIPILKNGSKCGDLELRFCLRSIQKHLTGYRHIVIVGHLPEFINPDSVIHIPFNDGPNKQANIRDKVIEAFYHEAVSDTVWFTNDDIFILKPFKASNFPFFYSGDLKDTSEKAARHFAYNELKEVDLPTRHYDIHTPILYKEGLFIEAMKHFSDDSSIKSKYANFWQFEGVELKDLKIASHLRKPTILAEIKDRPCFSVGDYGMKAEMIEVLNELFPATSKYELSNNQIKAA